MNRRLLFVGLTRARVHLEWVVSGGTEKLLERVLRRIARGFIQGTSPQFMHVILGDKREADRERTSWDR